jgi:acyl-CoA thioester hydrolase
MPRPDPSLLDPARYPFHCTIDTRFGDLDINRHVNNVAMARIFEDGRVRLFRASGYGTHHGSAQNMVASVAIEYLAEANYPAPITLHMGVSGIGRTSHTIAQLAMQDDLPVAFAQTVVVAVGKDGPVLISDDVRAAMSIWMFAA